MGASLAEEVFDSLPEISLNKRNLLPWCVTALTPSQLQTWFARSGRGPTQELREAPALQENLLEERQRAQASKSGVGARGVRPPFGTWISGAISGRRNFPRVGKSGRPVRIDNSLVTNVRIVSHNPNRIRQSTGSGRSGGHLDEEPVAPR